MKTPEEIEALALEQYVANHPELKDIPQDRWTAFDRHLLDAWTIGTYRALVFCQNIDDKYK